MTTPITVTTQVNVTPAIAWEIWTTPAHITQWNQASDDWHTPNAAMDLVPGGKLLWRMEARDGSMGFDFEATITEVIPYQKLAYTLADGRAVLVHFDAAEGGTFITETFDPESENSIELQQQGWQAILNSFKKYAEARNTLKTLNFSANINAPVEKVYETMLGDEGYRQWTSVFNASSHYVGSWEKGADIQFLGCDANGAIGGMVSKIKENIPFRFVSIEHIGCIENGETFTSGPKVDSWAGALENYSFSENDKITTVAVSIDTAGEWAEYFNQTWPKALERLKEICES
jgi:uncharacterized protein YndB with AHSA1/START domain